jgi:transmembrane sensor
MSQKLSQPWSDEDYAEACEWFVEFRIATPDTARREAFHAWLQQSPAHMGAYLEATALWNHTASFAPSEKYSMDALIAAAGADRDNVRVLEHSGELRHEAGVAASGRWSRLTAVAATVVILVAGIIGYIQFHKMPTYATAIGEQRSVMLPDGSIIQLNSRSRVQVRYGEHDRQIQLLEGQALFTVAHDKTRPFLVNAGETALRAVGTQFDVNRLATETVVTVLEGRVAVEQPASQPSSTMETSSSDAEPVNVTGEQGLELSLVIAAGEQLRVIRSGTVRRSSQADLAAATAWTQRRLVFEATPLADAVEEFNRYNPRPIRITSEQLNDFQIDGVFSSTDPEPLIRFLRTRPGIYVRESDRAIEISPSP